jgi:hypothetical protein
VGLHSYGFMDAAFRWLLLFVISQVVVIGVGSLPLTAWKSFQKAAPPAPPAGGARGTAPAPATT